MSLIDVYYVCLESAIKWHWFPVGLIFVVLFLLAYWQIMPFGHITPVRMVACRLMVYHIFIDVFWDTFCELLEIMFDGKTVSDNEGGGNRKESPAKLHIYVYLLLVWPICRTPAVGGLIVCEWVSECVSLCVRRHVAILFGAWWMADYETLHVCRVQWCQRCVKFW